MHFLGKAATFNLLYAFPLILIGEAGSAPAVVAKTFGWAFAWWGIGLYWWAGYLYVKQTVGLRRRYRHLLRAAPHRSA